MTKLCWIARLTLNNEDKEKLYKDLELIISSFAVIKEFNENIDEALMPYYIENIFRDDDPEPFTDRETLNKNFDSIERYVRGPKVIG